MFYQKRILSFEKSNFDFTEFYRTIYPVITKKNQFFNKESIFLTYQTTKMTQAFDQLSCSLLCSNLETSFISKSETRMKIFYETEERFLMDTLIGFIENMFVH